MRQKIRLDTMQDIQNFVDSVSKVPNKVVLMDDEGHCVSAKSVIGVAYSKLEWKNIYAICDEDITTHIIKWIM